MTDTARADDIMRPLMSGHCAFPQTADPDVSHDRCHRQGGGQRANPARIFQPCSCVCHFINDEGELLTYECSGCGRDIVEAPLWPYDEDGDVRYTHIDDDGNALGEACP